MQTVEALVEALEAAWNANDYAAIAELFDAHDAEPWYQAEEEAVLAAGWPALRDYFDRTARLNERIAVAFSDVRVKLLGDGVALIHYGLRWDIKLATYPKPLGGDCRVMAAARQGADGWRLVMYQEAPLSPISYVRRLYEMNVRPGVLDAAVTGQDSIQRS
jgi:ketosteroid isomerase-like protein